MALTVRRCKLCGYEMETDLSNFEKYGKMVGGEFQCSKNMVPRGVLRVMVPGPHIWEVIQKSGGVQLGRFCSRCGSQAVIPEAKFCNRCGNALTL